MSSAVVMERFAVGSPAHHQQHQWQPGAQAGQPGAQWCVVPRCKIEFEKCQGGCKIHCHCDDELSCGTLQNLCRMLCDGLCSCCCTQNGLQCCECSFTNCHCKCEYTNDGCTISCTSGDKQCCQCTAGLLRMLQQVLRERLRLLRVLQRHAGLLRPRSAASPATSAAPAPRPLVNV